MSNPARQPERTELAWYRTAIAMILVALLSLTVGVSLLNPFHLAGALVAGVSAAVMFFRGRSKSLSGDMTDVAVDRRVALALSGTVLAIGTLHAMGVLSALMTGP